MKISVIGAGAIGGNLALGSALAAADKAAAPATRDRLMAHFATFTQWPTHDEVVATNRSVHDTALPSQS